jgi:predicted GNAT family N-acyltransferase
MTIRVDPVVPIASVTDADGPFAACLEIRRRVFTEGQGVSLELEFDGLDQDAEHFIAWQVEAASTQPIGTARLRSVEGHAKIERVAVLESARLLGVGRALMNAVEESARRSGMDEAVLHAQLAVIPFYEQLGYHARGEIFEEAGIAHRAMTKRLASPLE